MIQIGEYTKDEMAAELELTAARDGSVRADAIIRKLKNLGYQFTTSGKGRTYRIYITRLPQQSIKDFAAEYLGITARFEDRLTHFLQLLFTSGNTDYVNYSYRSLEWVSPSSYNTIENWMKSLIDCGLLLEEPLVGVYYATQREIVDEDIWSGDYDYTQKIKFITKEEYDLAVQAYNDCIADFGDISKNPDVVADEVMFWANSARRAALDGWWAMRKRDCDMLRINTNWPQLPQLIALLDNIPVWEYHRLKQGNHAEDTKRFEERVEKWKEEKEAKRKKLAEAEQKEITYTKDKKVEVETKTGETILFNIPPAKIRDNSEVEAGDSFKNYIIQLGELFYKTKKGFYEYDEE